MGRQADLEAPLLARPTLFVGRDEELTQLREAFERVPVALICGVGGVGKSALAAAFAETWPGPVIHTDLVSDALAELVDDARTALGTPAAGDFGPIDGRLRALAAHLDQAGGLWLIDDLHRLSPADRRLSFAVLGRSVRRGRVLAASRERIGLDARGPDHAELRLGGLADPDARRLWSLLDAMYGPAGGLEAALARASGNPFLIRRAHAGDLSDDDPLGESLAGLGPEERAVAGALALSEGRLPFSLLVRLVDAAPARDAVRRLVARLLLEAHADGSLSMHDLAREAVIRHLGADERERLHGALARLLPESELDPARRARAVCRHLRALDRHEEAARYLIDRGSELDRYGAAGELLRGLVAIPRERRSPEASAALIRASARAFDLIRAWAEHERLLEHGAAPPVELATVHAMLALLIGRPAEAEATLDRIDAAGELPPAVAIRVLTTRATVRLFAGEPGEAPAILAAAARAATHPRSAGPLWLYCAFALWVEERDVEGDEAIRRAVVLRGEDALSYRGQVLTSTMQGALAASLGHFDAAEQALRDARDLMQGDEDQLLWVYVDHGRAFIAAERGDWNAALHDMRATIDRFHHGGHLVGELSVAARMARLLMIMGRRAEAVRLLEEGRANAERRGLHGLVREFDRARAHDPLRLLDRTGPPVSARASGHVWDRSIEAIRAAAAGDAAGTMALLAAEAPRSAVPGHELGRVLAAVAEAALALATGSGGAAGHLARARAAAAEGGLGDEIVPALLGSLGSVRVVRADGGRITAADAIGIDPRDRVIDAHAQELRHGDTIISLQRRPALSKLLLAMARHPGAVTTKDELAAALWSRAHDPCADAGPLKANVANLRRLIEPIGLAIDFEVDGYRLAGERTVLIEPVFWPQD